MKVRIETISPDGLVVTFNEGFAFDTWDQAFSFITQVEKISHNPLNEHQPTPEEVYRGIKRIDEQS